MLTCNFITVDCLSVRYSFNAVSDGFGFDEALNQKMNCQSRSC